MLEDDKYTSWEERDMEEESTIVQSFIARQRRHEEAMEVLRARANSGDAQAQYNMGKLCEVAQADFEVKEDRENFKHKGNEAFSWYKKAAEGGHLEGQYHLAMFYLYGNSGTVHTDLKQAEYWLKIAAKQGHLDAKYQLSKETFKK